MKIYTKKGDKGYTALLGGVKVSKGHARIDAYGNVDELNSFAGLARDGIKDEPIRESLKTVQKHLFTIGALLAAPEKAREQMDLPAITTDEVEFLEKMIDKMEKKVTELKSFILPGGHPSVSWCHIARTVCRRAERSTVSLSDTENVDPVIITYLNRLSDMFFVLARFSAVEQKVEEIKWLPGKE